MATRTTKGHFVRAYVLITCVVMLGYLLLLPGGIYNASYGLFFVAVSAIPFSLYVLKEARLDSDLSRAIHPVKYFCVATLLITVLVMLGTLLSYNCTFYRVVMNACPYLCCLFAFPLIYLFNLDGGFDKTLSHICIAALCMLALKALLWYLFNFHGVVLFENLLFEYEGWSRDGNTRLSAGYLVGMLAAYLFTTWKNSKSLPSFLLSILLLLYLAFVSAYRVQAIATVICYLIISFLTSGKKHVVFLKRMFTACLILALLTSAMFGDMLSTFSTDNTMYGGSTQIRLDAISYFGSLAAARSTVFGLGFMTSADLSAFGASRVYYLEDLGFLGEFFRIGFFSIVTYGFLLFMSFRACKVAKNDGLQVDYLFVAGLTAYLLVSSIAMNVFDMQRSFDVPFYIAIFSYTIAGCSKKKRGNEVDAEYDAVFKLDQILSGHIGSRTRNHRTSNRRQLYQTTRQKYQYDQPTASIKGLFNET